MLNNHIKLICLAYFTFVSYILSAQSDTIILGQSNNTNIIVTSSSETNVGSSSQTTNQSGFLPNLNKASRFLSQATLGYNYNDILQVQQMGIEDWLDMQLNLPRPSTLLSQVRSYVNYAEISTKEEHNSNRRMWSYAWWQYHMTSDDYVRQRVALALSEIIVISENSNFSNNGYALSDFYDIFLNNATENYRDILEEVTMHAAMANYLTYMNNPKSDTSQNRFPDENYARELMQLFTIGLHELNLDGSVKLDSTNQPIPTYDNYYIAEFAKIFTGFSWEDRDNFYRGSRRDTSYIPQLKMFNEYHEPGEKFLLNEFVVPDRDPVDGIADVQDAIDNLFNHPNTGPFISKALIQRLITSNPSPEYIERVATVFNDNGQGVRGDMKSVIKAILLDPIANDCSSAEDISFGMLREPYIRYFQLNKAFNATTESGNYRNDMNNVYGFVEQRPLASPSVFNFFQPDYQPLGAVNDSNLVAPEFQITDAKTIAGYVNGLYEWVIRDNVADEYDIYGGEPDSLYENERSHLDLGLDTMYTNDDNLHILLDRINTLMAHGQLSDEAEEIIIETIKEFPNESSEDKEGRVRLAIYFVMTAPEYLINR